jgi:signal peptidase I
VKRGLLVALVALGALVFLTWLAAVLFARPYRIPSQNMDPTLQIGDRILARRGGLDDPERGKIVVYHPPGDGFVPECAVPRRDDQACPRAQRRESDETFVARVVAVGGDRVSIRGGRVVIDGKPVEEDYARLDESCQLCHLPRPITIPPDHVFVVGDNRAGSADSREWGPIPDDSIVGPVMVRYWPPGRWGTP